LQFIIVAGNAVASPKPSDVRPSVAISQHSTKRRCPPRVLLAEATI
jgi:hypothetical protein